MANHQNCDYTRAKDGSTILNTIYSPEVVRRVWRCWLKHKVLGYVTQRKCLVGLVRRELARQGVELSTVTILHIIQYHKPQL